MKAIGLVALALLLGAPPLEAREYLKQERAQSRGFSQGVVTDGGKILWLAGQVALTDEQGQSLAGNFEGQARRFSAPSTRSSNAPGAASRMSSPSRSI